MSDHLAFSWELWGENTGISCNAFPASRLATRGDGRAGCFPQAYGGVCWGVRAGEAGAPLQEGRLRALRTGAGSCTGAAPAGSLRAPPAAAAASAPPRTPSACRSAPPLWSWAEGRESNTVSKKGRTAGTWRVDPISILKERLGNTEGFCEFCKKSIAIFSSVRKEVSLYLLF